MDSPFRLRIVDAQAHELVTFAAGGPVERDLVAAITKAVDARVCDVLHAVQARGRWWIRPAQFDAAIEASLKESLPGVVSAAVDAVLLDLKLETTAKHLG